MWAPPRCGTIIGRENGAGGLEVLAFSVVPSEGLKKGNVVDIAATYRSIQTSIGEAEERAGIKVRSAYVGVTGAHVSFENRWDELGWAGRRGVITAEDLTRVPTAVAPLSKESGRRVIHSSPIAYSLDGQQGIRNPLGMHTRNLAVETHLVTGASHLLNKLTAAVESVGVQVEGLVLEPLASSEAVMTFQEREGGAAVADIGGGTTDLVVFKKGSMIYTGVIPVGGYQFTNDICLTFDAPYDAAEEVKLKYGHTEPHMIPPQEEVSMPVEGTLTQLRISRREICQLMRERAQELARLIRLKLEEMEIGRVSNIPLILTGGTSGLPGLDAMMQRLVTNHVRLGVPMAPGGLPPELRAPSFATGVGILLWATSRHKPVMGSVSNGSGATLDSGPRVVVSRLLTQMRQLFSLRPFSLNRWRM